MQESFDKYQQMATQLCVPGVLSDILLKSNTAIPVAAPGRESSSAIAAAVLMPIVLRDEPSMLLTQRALHLYDHPGQVSFPGGRVDDGDADAVMTALRETQEEIGVSANYIDIVGQLPDVITGTGFRITPVVGIVKPDFTLQIDAFEVASVFEVPLAQLLRPDAFGSEERMWQGRPFMTWRMNYQQYTVWGATAHIIVEFTRQIRRSYGEQDIDTIDINPSKRDVLI